MKILWLNAGLLLPLDKGGKLRTWHVMRHLAARHDITYLSFADAVADRGRPRRHARGVLDGSKRCRAPIPAKGTWRFYADAARYVVDRAPYAVAKYRSDGVSRARCRDAARRGALRRRRLRLPAAGREPAGAAALPVDSLHAQRRSGDLAPSRGDRRTNPVVALPADAAVAAHAPLRSATRSRASTWCSPSRRPTATRSSGSIPDALRRAGARRSRPASTPATSRRAPDRGRARAHGLHRLDGLAAERRRHGLLLPRDPAAHPAGRSPTPRSASSAARRRPAVKRLAEMPASRSPAASTTCGRTSRAARSTSCRCASAAARA